MQMPVPSRRTPAGNTATGWLKVLALVFMFIDHAGKVLFSNMQEMRVLGRIAFPLYVWCMIVGFFYTRCVWKYMLRVLVTGLVSQPLYVVALNHQWNEPNIFLTLLLGLCALWGIRENKYGSRIWAPAIALALATVLGANYGWKGVLLFILLYAVQESRAGIAAVLFPVLGGFLQRDQKPLRHQHQPECAPGLPVRPALLFPADGDLRAALAAADPDPLPEGPEDAPMAGLCALSRAPGPAHRAESAYGCITIRQVSNP